MSTLRSDCSACCGLCCIVPDQLATQGFPLDKPADTPCHHLEHCRRCAIHDTRHDQGYGACDHFDCFGAGQWITQQLFGGASWSDSPDLAARMSAAYRHWAPLFEAAALLEAAIRHAPANAVTALTRQIEALLTAPEGEKQLTRDPARLRHETILLIRSLLA